MTEAALKALTHLQFSYTPTMNDVWRRAASHVDGLHTDVLRTILDGLALAKKNPDTSPIGVAVQGQRGAGKTHLLSRVRELTQLDGGYFFLINLLDANAFWHSVAVSMVDGLHQPVDDDGTTQLQMFLHRLVVGLELSVVTRMAVTGRAPMTVDRLNEFVAALSWSNRRIGIGCRDTARALALLAGIDPRAQDVANSWLLASDEAEPGERLAWGIRPARRLPQEIVSDMSRLLALTGPSVIGVDQVDGLIAQVANRSHVSEQPSTGAEEDGWRAAVSIDQVASGLMELRELTQRTLTVLSLLPVSWALIKSNAVDTAQDRFRETAPLESIPDADLGRTLVERRLAAHYAEVGFVPPYPSWPVRPEAFADAADFTPRQLLINVERHIRACVRDGQVTEMTTLTTLTTAAAEKPTAEATPTPTSTTRTRTPAADGSSLGTLDQRYAELRAAAQVAGLLDPANEDTQVPQLLAAGLRAWTWKARTRTSTRTRSRPAGQPCTPGCAAPSTTRPATRRTGRSGPSPRSTTTPSWPGCATPAWPPGCPTVSPIGDCSSCATTSGRKLLPCARRRTISSPPVGGRCRSPTPTCGAWSRCTRCSPRNRTDCRPGWPTGVPPRVPRCCRPRSPTPPAIRPHPTDPAASRPPSTAPARTCGSAPSSTTAIRYGWNWPRCASTSPSSPAPDPARPS
ncbi:hypothetical protein [Micromonospora sp. LOL_021]|uniref:hypothetical protein n=1 Tax=Micromonospora sp. LOL_021 TaxID=3345417 RepID=UPI003A8353C5